MEIHSYIPVTFAKENICPRTFKAEGRKAPRRPRQVLKVAADNG